MGFLGISGFEVLVLLSMLAIVIAGVAVLYVVVRRAVAAGTRAALKEQEARRPAREHEGD